jgi:hypothetical protein
LGKVEQNRFWFYKKRSKIVFGFFMKFPRAKSTSTSTFNKAFSEAKSQIAFGFLMKFQRAKSTFKNPFLEKVEQNPLFKKDNKTLAPPFPKVDKKEVLGFFLYKSKKIEMLFVCYCNLL